MTWDTCNSKKDFWGTMWQSSLLSITRGVDTLVYHSVLTHKPKTHAAHSGAQALAVPLCRILAGNTLHKSSMQRQHTVLKRLQRVTVMQQWRLQGSHVFAVEVPDVNAVVFRAADDPLALPVCDHEAAEHAVLRIHVACTGRTFLRLSAGAPCAMQGCEAREPGPMTGLASLAKGRKSSLNLSKLNLHTLATHNAFYMTNRCAAAISDSPCF